MPEQLNLSKPPVGAELRRRKVPSPHTLVPFTFHEWNNLCRKLAEMFAGTSYDVEWVELKNGMIWPYRRDFDENHTPEIPGSTKVP